MKSQSGYMAIADDEKGSALLEEAAEPAKTGAFPWRRKELLAVLIVVTICFAASMDTSKHRAIEIQCPQPDPVELSDVSLALRDQEATDKAVRLLQESIRIPTVSYDDLKPPGEDERWAPFDDFNVWLEKSFPVLFDKSRHELVSNYTHLFTLKGARSDLLPAIFIHHIDVVPVYNEELWRFPPFAAQIEDGWLYGRGASDDKGNLIALLVALESLLKSGWTPERTLITIAHQDEEASAEYGSQVVSKLLEERLGEKGAALIVDEGSGYAGQIYGQHWFPIDVAEKGYADLEIKVSIPGGHSADPKKHTSVNTLLKLAAAYDATKRPRPAFTVDHPLAQQAACLAQYGEGDVPKKLRKVLKKGDLRRLHDFIMPILQTTTYTPTILNAGGKTNVIPPVAIANFNHRLAVGTSLEEVNKTLHSTLAPIVHRAHLSFGKEVSLRWHSVEEASFISSTASPGYAALVAAGRGVFPGVKFLPSILPGATDSRNYQKVARQIYRISPVAGLPSTDHATDERIEIKFFIAASQFYVEFMLGIDRIKSDEGF